MSCNILQNLASLCALRNLNPAGLAGLTGISGIRIRDILNLKSMPDAAEVVAFSKGLSVPADLLLCGNFSKALEKVEKFNLGMLILDIDGVMTDAGIYYTENGDEIKKFNARDGLGIISLTRAGKKVGFVSSGFSNAMILKRAKVLGVEHVYTGTWAKKQVVAEWSRDLNIPLEHMAYIGDDINDIPVIEMVGLSACPADAVPEVKAISDIILSTNGGRGCIREFIDTYLFLHKAGLSDF